MPFFQQEQHASVIFHSELFAFRVWALTRLRFSKLPGKGEGGNIQRWKGEGTEGIL